MNKRLNETKNIRHIKFLLLTSYFILHTFFTGCASVQDYRESPGKSQGQVTMLLKGPDKTTSDISFELSAINILSDDGIYREIMNMPMNISSVSLTGRQIQLSEKFLPEGRYRKLQFMVKQALIKRKDRTANLALPTEGIEIDIDITVKRNQNTSLFLTWNADASVTEGYLFKPVLAAKGQVPELSTLLVYVTNEGSDNVSVINRQSGEVVGTIMVGKQPRGIGASPWKENPRIFVANSGSNSISVIDPTTNTVETEIPIRFGREPEGIAVVRLSQEKGLIFVTNYGSNNVSVVDARTYQEIDKIRVGDGPIAIAADPPVECLFTSRFLNFDDINALKNYREKFLNVYVANKNSKDVSVIRMDIMTGRTDEVIPAGVEWSPVALAVDYPRGKVYVGNYNYDNISVIDILHIQAKRTVAVSSIANIGTSVVGIIPEPDLDRMYLLKELSGEIMIIRPFAEAYGVPGTRMSPIIGTITVGNSPRSLILDPEGRKLYVVNRGSDSVSVIDKTTRREELVIPVGRKPYGITMFPF